MADLFEERFAEGQDVGRSCPKWRELDVEDLQPIEEVLAKIAALERLFQIAIGRAITRTFAFNVRVDQSLELALLRDTKELGLCGCAHLGDFVEKALRPPPARSARLGLLRASERATLVAEGRIRATARGAPRNSARRTVRSHGSRRDG
jgi:hypothetical protein